MSSSRVISQACGECRARKIKVTDFSQCDLQHPACARCIRSGRQCPGYRDQLALWFRDESQSVAQRTKATTHSAPSIGRRTQRSIMEEAFTKTLAKNEFAQRGELFLVPLSGFVVDVEDRASCYFFEVFDWIGASVLVEGSFEYTTSSRNAPLGERALLAGISAVGKASLANIQNSAFLRDSASDDYVATLKLVNMALGDVQQLKKDTTLNAIFLLSIFEMIAGQGPKSLDNWLNHINGAARLLESRYNDDLSRTSPPAMFYSWRFSMIQCCLFRKFPVPLKLVDLSKRLAGVTRCPVSAASRDLTILLAKLASICNRIEIENIDDTSFILAELDSIDVELTEWAIHLSPSCNYDWVATLQPLELSGNWSLQPINDYSHKYPGIWVANMWNQYRAAKLQVHELTLAQLQNRATSSGPDAENAQVKCAEARTQMRHLAEDICCSVPYVLGLLGQEKREPSPCTPTVKSSAGALYLMWPLAYAGLADPVLSQAYEFVCQCFDLIAYGMGVHQAFVFREMVVSRSTQYLWADEFWHV